MHAYRRARKPGNRRHCQDSVVGIACKTITQKYTEICMYESMPRHIQPDLLKIQCSTLKAGVFKRESRNVVVMSALPFSDG